MFMRDCVISLVISWFAWSSQAVASFIVLAHWSTMRYIDMTLYVIGHIILTPMLPVKPNGKGSNSQRMKTLDLNQSVSTTSALYENKI